MRGLRPDDQHAARTVLLCLENTHNRCGGRVLSLDYLKRVQDWALSKVCPFLSPPLFSVFWAEGFGTHATARRSVRSGFSHMQW